MTETLTLTELTLKIKESILASFPVTYWIVAEIAELRVNKNGHCYLELIDKNELTEEISARQRATIWSYSYKMIKPYFEMTSGRTLEAGIKIMVNAIVEFHEVYGLSLNIKDIDPIYTIGDLARKKLEIIARLESEGIFNLNRELTLPIVVQRIAIISSETAAGFGDFIHQLENNEFGYKFHYQLFQSQMQGSKSAETIIEALDKIYSTYKNFDAIVIIRGGGSRAELSCFDNYDLACHISQFPLPVLSGIGHERDESVVDLVAHTKLKTPTAVAEFLIAKAADFENTIDDCAQLLKDFCSNKLESEKTLIEKFVQQISLYSETIINREKIILGKIPERLKRLTEKLFISQANKLNLKLLFIKQFSKKITDTEYQYIEKKHSAFQFICKTFIIKQKHQLSVFTKTIEVLDPENTLKRGFTMTLLNGKILKSVMQLKENDVIENRFSDGCTESVVKQIRNN